MRLGPSADLLDAVHPDRIPWKCTEFQMKKLMSSQGVSPYPSPMYPRVPGPGPQSAMYPMGLYQGRYPGGPPGPYSMGGMPPGVYPTGYPPGSTPFPPGISESIDFID